jgi:hypothetical protein
MKSITAILKKSQPTMDGPALSLTLIGQILKHWRKQLRAANRDPQFIEHTLGLTPAEHESKA